MCSVGLALFAVAAAASIASDSESNRQTKRTVKALNAQNELRADEINQQAGQELNERSRAARKERAAARVAASEAGVNLGSGSFLALLQSSEVQQAQESGVILKNKDSAQKARQAEYTSQLSQHSYVTGVGMVLNAASAGAGAYISAGGKTDFGKKGAAGNNQARPRGSNTKSTGYTGNKRGK